MGLRREDSIFIKRLWRSNEKNEEGLPPIAIINGFDERSSKKRIGFCLDCNHR